MNELPIDQILCGDAAELSRGKLPNCSIHAMVTDPPYGLEFMGEGWDKFRPDTVSPKWSSGGGFSSPGIGQRQTPWPSHYATSFFGTANPTCDICGGRLRGSKKCICEKPKWRVKGKLVEESNLPIFQWSTVKYAVAYYEFTLTWAKEALRILKPGASMLVMGGTRTYHRMACGVEDVGFVIKDCLAWCYNSGFPKAQDLGKMIDKRLGVQREVVGEREVDVGMQSGHMHAGRPTKVVKVPITVPATPEAKKWDGWRVGGLKPAYEPILWAVKPPDGAYIDNVLKHEVGAINVDGCMIPYESENDKKLAKLHSSKGSGSGVYNWNLENGKSLKDYHIGKGRYPANMIRTDRFHDGYDRFYFVPKASRAERDEGLESLQDFKGKRAYHNRVCKKCEKHELQSDINLRCVCENPEWISARKKSVKNIHPTVKPVRLGEHLIGLVTRPGQIVADFFCGSGSFLVAARKLNRHYIGFDNNPEYVEISKHRLAAIPRPMEVYT